MDQTTGIKTQSQPINYDDILQNISDRMNQGYSSQVQLAQLRKKQHEKLDQTKLKQTLKTKIKQLNNNATTTDHSPDKQAVKKIANLERLLYKLQITDPVWYKKAVNNLKYLMKTPPKKETVDGNTDLITKIQKQLQRNRNLPKKSRQNLSKKQVYEGWVPFRKKIYTYYLNANNKMEVSFYDPLQDNPTLMNPLDLSPTILRKIYNDIKSKNKAQINYKEGDSSNRWWPNVKKWERN